MPNIFDHDLTPRQLRFCLNYLSNKFRSTKAAMIDAGYNRQYAERSRHNILKNSKILSFLRTEMERRAEDEYVKNINFELEVCKRAMNEPDPDLRAKYAAEVRQWQKQKEEFNLKLQELEARIKEVKESKDDNNAQTINFNVITKE